MYVSKFQIYIYKRKIKLYQHNFHNYYIMDQSWRDNFGIYTSCLQAAWPSDNPKKVRGYNRIPSTEQIQPCPGNLIPIHHSQLQTPTKVLLLLSPLLIIIPITLNSYKSWHELSFCCVRRIVIDTVLSLPLRFIIICFFFFFISLGWLLSLRPTSVFAFELPLILLFRTTNQLLLFYYQP